MQVQRCLCLLLVQQFGGLPEIVFIILTGKALNQSSSDVKIDSMLYGIIAYEWFNGFL